MSPSYITLQTRCLTASQEVEISVFVLYLHTVSQVGMSSVNILSENGFFISILTASMDLLKWNKNKQQRKINSLVDYFKLITVNSL